MKPFILKCHHTILETLVQSIDVVLSTQRAEDDIDRLILSTLYSLNQRFKIKLVRPKERYSFSLQPNEAMALRLHYTEYIGEPTTYLGSFVMAVANQVDQFYSHSNIGYENANHLPCSNAATHVRNSDVRRP